MRFFLVAILIAGAARAATPEDWASAAVVESHDRIEQHWKVVRRPSDERMRAMRLIDMAPENSDRRLKTRFEMLIKNDGTVAGRVIESSGVEAYDRAVLDAIGEYLYEPLDPAAPPPTYILPFEM
ncbi:TonB C-terminal domain-containing protein [Wenzhouxiangella sp. XN79A]|uniref:TonB C-terminal domain-containing protein n=1 Tax=Wenzhouxiangella sp. XN79A TaxID=2724193 RepID=UPI00144A7FF1|nr:TonB C-terminal domain-containing protein [Wenzhouxiangella sp. XN79A]NKI34920.1 TonB C-terminal domain-containing protein [Wenzhouxiangella sp. XN79A]